MRYTQVLTEFDHRQVKKSNNVHMILHVYIQHNCVKKKTALKSSNFFRIFCWYFLMATVFINSFLSSVRRSNFGQSLSHIFHCGITASILCDSL